MPGEYAVTAINWGTVLVALAGIAGTWHAGWSASKSAREIQKDRWTHEEAKQNRDRRREIYSEFLRHYAEFSGSSLTSKTFKTMESMDALTTQLSRVQIFASLPVAKAAHLAWDAITKIEDASDEQASRNAGAARQAFVSAVRSELGVED